MQFLDESSFLEIDDFTSSDFDNLVIDRRIIIIIITYKELTLRFMSDF